VVHLTDEQVTASEAFAFDQRGNLTIDANGAAFNAQDRLTSTTACSNYAYDLAGNLTGKTCNGKDWEYTYDAVDRLTTVTFDGAFVAAYTYDVLGNRIAKRTATDTTRFVWRSGLVLYETNAAGTVRYSYQWGLGTDDLLAIHDHGSDAHYYVVQDKLHSVRGLVNRDGTWKAAWRYRGYGVVLDSAVAGSTAGLHRFGWAGAQYDAETGFYFLRTRYSDPVVGRFVQEDKIGRAGGLNLYAYAGGRPLAARDPMGTMDDYYLLGELTWAPASHNCWGIVCDPDGFDGREGGGGDWDGDGRNDLDDFIGYSWGRSQYNGYRETYRYIDRVVRWTVSDPNARNAGLDILYSGRVKAYTGSPTNIALTQPRGPGFHPELNRVGRSFEVTGVRLDGFTININENSARWRESPAVVAFAFMHEVYHLLGFFGGHYGDANTELGANCYARSATGNWTLYIPTRYSCQR
jgi:RHS repeat-associated protein